MRGVRERSSGLLLTRHQKDKIRFRFISFVSHSPIHRPRNTDQGGVNQGREELAEEEAGEEGGEEGLRRLDDVREAGGMFGW